MCSLYGAETAAVFIFERIASARKPHRCATCITTIAAGASYQRNRMVFDGRASSEAQCEPCYAIGERFSDAHDFWPAPSGLLEHVSGCADWEGDGEWKRAADEIEARRLDACKEDARG